MSLKNEDSVEADFRMMMYVAQKKASEKYLQLVKSSVELPKGKPAPVYREYGRVMFLVWLNVDLRTIVRRRIGLVEIMNIQSFDLACSSISPKKRGC